MMRSSDPNRGPQVRSWSPRRLALVVAFVVGLSGLVAAAPIGVPAGADPGDIGWEGPSFQGASGSPSGSKPQSKVWFHDGLWWATLYASASDEFHIWRLDVATRTWIDTGTLVDTRRNSRSDALWTGQHLYIANHVFSESGGTAPAQLRRYSYDSATKRYTADAGFPVAINQVRSETLVIDREPTGRLWATWVQSGQVMVAHTTTADTVWSSPFALPVAGSAATSDDISAVVAYRSDRIGILWSNQADDTMSFAYHLNSSPPGTWSRREIAYSGTDAADDHIDLAPVQDVGGRVLAAVKTSRSGAGVMTHLLDRDPSGAWTSHTYGLGSDNHTRPIVVVDSEHQRAHMFATRGQAGGTIYEKTAPLSDLDFPPGPGTPVLTDASSADINNATSTKQPVSSATGLVVVATNDSTRQYWTHYDPLTGTDPPPPGTDPDPPPASGTTTTFTATADGLTKSSSPGRSYATDDVLRLRAPDPEYQSFVRFDLTGLPGAPTEARLRLFVTDASPSGGTVTRVGTGWTEGSLTWASRPSPVGGPLDTAGPAGAGQWVDYEVTSAVAGNGAVAFRLHTTSTNSLITSSREGAHPPQLVVTVGGTAPPPGSDPPTPPPEPPPEPPPPPPGTELTFPASDDGKVQTGNPTKSYGTTADLQARAPSPAYESFLRFDLSGLAAPPTSVKLRLWVTDSSPVAAAVTPVDPGWTESSLTWEARPQAGPGPAAALWATATGTWVEVDLTGLVTGGGPVAVGLAAASTNSVKFSSREGTHPPQLVVVP